VLVSVTIKNDARTQMKIGDLVMYKNKFHIVTKTYGTMVSLSGKDINRVFRKEEIKVINKSKKA
jgi:hypothetical protein